MALDYKSSLSRYRKYIQLVRERPLWTASMWVIMSLILLIVLLVLALRPTLITISGLIGQVKQQKEISIKLDGKIAQVQQAITEMNSVASKILLLDTALPATPKWMELANSLNGIATATKSGLTVTDLVIEKIPLSINEPLTAIGTQPKTQVPSGVIPVRFSLTFNGNYPQMRKVISDLENMRRVPILSSVDISINDEGVQTLIVSGEAGYIPN